jgi:hypothetical protein
MRYIVEILIAIIEVFCVLFSTFLVYYAFFIDAGFRILPIFLLSTLSILEISIAYAFPIDYNNPVPLIRFLRSTFGYGTIIFQPAIKIIAAYMFLAYIFHFALFFVSSVKPTSFSSGGSVIAGSIVLILNVYLYFFKK